MRQGVIALVIKGDKILMGKKVERPGHFLSNAWHFPGGKADDGEQLEDALVREMNEELGVKLTIIKKICEYDLTLGVTKSHNTVFLCATDEEPIARDDLAEARYFTKDEILAQHHKESYHNLPDVVKSYVDSL